MKRSRHQRVKDLFEGARCRSRSERRSFLAEACGADDALRDEVQSLLDLHDAAPGFLLQPALGRDFRLPAPDVVAAEDPAVPERIGQYEILGLLGAGGMGVVYAARQERPRRAVALKVLRPGVTTSGLLRRFEHETQTLARLQHPGIAQIFEAGTFGQGRAAQPFFAMELVSGCPLTEHCDARGFDVRQRLALLARVCDAVHHAHQHGVVHRDLKPGNILVQEATEPPEPPDDSTTDGRALGQPKVLDFGVARVTDSDVQATTVGTDVGQLLGTVPYMSPEQVAGDPHAVDTRCDVYALGVIAYELLTGRLPLDVRHASIPEAAQLIRDAEPDRLGSVDRRLRGDVETIVATAMDKDKTRRYPSAAALGADLRRFLLDEPIVARPASTFYHLRKFAKRNRALVAGFVLACTALLVATVVSGVFWRRAERRGVALTAALGTAELEADKVSAINDFLVGMLRSVDPSQIARDVTVREVLDRAAGTIDDAFAEQPLVRAELRRAIASSYGGLGLFENGLAHARAAVDLHTEQLGGDHPQTLTSLNLLAGLLDWLGRYDEAEPLFVRTLETRRRVLGEHHPDTLAAATNRGLMHYRQGRRAEAEALWTATRDACRRHLDADSPVTLHVGDKLAWLYHEQGRLADAEAMYVETLATRRRTRGVAHPRTLTTLNSLGRLYHDRGRYEDAETLLREALETQRGVLGGEHYETLRTMENLGWLYTRLGRYDEATTLLEEVLATRRRVFGDDHPATPYAMNSLAVCYQDQGRIAEAETLKVEALEIRRRIKGPEHPETLVSMSNLAAVYFHQQRYDDAETLWTRVLEIRRRVLGARHPETVASQYNLGLLYAEQERFSEADELYDTVLEVRRLELGAEHWLTLNTQASVGRLRHLMGRYDDAERILAETLDGARRTLPTGHWFAGHVQRYHGETLTALGRFEAAEATLREAHAILAASRGVEHDQTRAAAAALTRVNEARQRASSPRWSEVSR